MGQFDQAHFEDYLGFIASQQRGFQTLLTATLGNIDLTKLAIDCVHVAVLHGKEKNVTIGP